METADVIAALAAGIIAPFLQEILFGAKVQGRAAAWTSMGVTFVIATAATWVTGGFAGAAGVPAFNFLDPSAFFAFWWSLWAPVFAIAKVVHGITTSRSSGEAKGPIQTVAEKVQPVIGTSPG